MASTYSTRPSSFLGLPADSWEAFQVDLACLRLGREIESKLAERDKNGKPKHTVASIMSDFAPAREQLSVRQETQYASLREHVTRKVRIPENGIWDIEA